MGADSSKFEASEPYELTRDSNKQPHNHIFLLYHMCGLLFNPFSAKRIYKKWQWESTAMMSQS